MRVSELGGPNTFQHAFLNADSLDTCPWTLLQSSCEMCLVAVAYHVTPPWGQGQNWVAHHYTSVSPKAKDVVEMSLKSPGKGNVESGQQKPFKRKGFQEVSGNCGVSFQSHLDPGHPQV